MEIKEARRRRQCDGRWILGCKVTAGFVIWMSREKSLQDLRAVF
jgi:hypothetical protein